MKFVDILDKHNDNSLFCTFCFSSKYAYWLSVRSESMSAIKFSCLCEGDVVVGSNVIKKIFEGNFDEGVFNEIFRFVEHMNCNVEVTYRICSNIIEIVSKQERKYIFKELCESTVRTIKSRLYCGFDQIYRCYPEEASKVFSLHFPKNPVFSLTVLRAVCLAFGMGFDYIIQNKPKDEGFAKRLWSDSSRKEDAYAYKA